jgi:hypothetical protein
MTPPRNANASAPSDRNRRTRRHPGRRSPRHRPATRRGRAPITRRSDRLLGVEPLRQPQAQREAPVTDRKQLRGIVDDLARASGMNHASMTVAVLSPPHARTTFRRVRSSRSRARHAERLGHAPETAAPEPTAPRFPAAGRCGTTPPPARKSLCKPANARSGRRRRRRLSRRQRHADRQDHLARITIGRDVAFGNPCWGRPFDRPGGGALGQGRRQFDGDPASPGLRQ